MISELVSLLLCLNLISPNESAKILGVFPMDSPSHYILGGTLMRALAEAGHDITVIAPFPEKEIPKKATWRQIVIENFSQSKHINMFDRVDFNPVVSTVFLTVMGSGLSELVLNNTDVQKLINSNEKFDVVIVNQFVNDALKAFAKYFDAHLILFSNTAANTWINHFVGNPSLPSHSPEMLLHLPKKMSFLQRVNNTIYKFLYSLLSYLYFYPKQNTLVQKYFPKPIDLYEVFDNISLVLLNSHTSIFDPQPFVPCMVEIGGFHVKPPKQLPDDLQKFLDDANEGVIYFSMGSNLKSKNLPDEKKQAILKAFAKRKEKILWKWEDDILPGQPSNVKLGKWLPQQEILAHPNVKLFITHGGLLSTIETVYHGVPIITIPIYGDQMANAHMAQEAGYALTLRFKELTEEKLSTVLEEILGNPTYRENAKKRSEIMKDRQVKPLDNAVYWVEYVIRHNGAKHLKVAYLDLTWYQFYLLDVLGFIFGVTLVVVIVFKKLLSYVCRRKVNRIKLKDN